MSLMTEKTVQGVSLGPDTENDSKTEDATDSDMSPNGRNSKGLTELAFSLRIWRVTVITAIILFAVLVLTVIPLSLSLLLHRNNPAAAVAAAPEAVPEDTEETH